MTSFAAISETPLSALLDSQLAVEAIAALYLSTSGFSTNPGETPANAHFAPRVRQALRFRRSLAGGGFGGSAFAGFAGGAGVRFGIGPVAGQGEIEIDNSDGALDSFVQDYAIDGRRVVVRLGKPGFAYADFGTVFTGTAVQWLYDRATVRVPLRDPLYKLAVPVQGNLYGGTGGTDGGADLKNKPKPLLYGECLNVPAVLVDPGNLIYQVHDGQMQALDAVYDRGVLLTAGVGYTADLANGRFTLLAAPAGTITADVKGSKTGGVYLDRAGDIARRIVTDQALLTNDDYDAGAFAALANAQSSAVGIYVTEPMTVVDVLSELLAGAGAWFGCNRLGQLQAAVFAAPDYPARASFDETDVIRLDRLPLPEGLSVPWWRARVAYQRNWTVQTTDLAGSVSAARRAFLAEPVRVAGAVDTAVLSAHVLANDPPPAPGLFAGAAEAGNEAARLLALYGVKRDLFRVVVKHRAFALNVGDAVLLAYNRFGLSAGRLFRIVSLNDDASRNEVEMELFG